MSNHEKVRGQGSIEYLIIVAAMLFLFATITVPVMIDPTSRAASDGERVAQARVASYRIASVIHCVYANGEGSMTTETIKLDGRWELQIENHLLRVGTKTSDGWRYVEENLGYTFDHQKFGNLENSITASAGTYIVTAEWTKDTEGIEDNHIENNRICIYLNPQGG